MSCLQFTQDSATSFGSGSQPAITIVDKDGQEWYMNPPPLIGWTTNDIYQGGHYLGSEANVTLSCFAAPCTDSTNPVTDMLGVITTVESKFSKGVTLKVFGDAGGAPAATFNIINPSVSAEESGFYNLVRFTVQFTSFGPNGSGSVDGAVTSILHGSTNTNSQAIPLQSFSDTFNYEPETSMGYIYDDPGAQLFRFSRTVSATERPIQGGHTNRTSTFGHTACSGAKAFVDSRMAVTDFSPYYVDNHFRYIEGVNVLNMATSVNIDLAELTYSVTINGLYATETAANMIKQSGAFETTTTTVQTDASSAITSVTIDGSLNGYAVGASTDPTLLIHAGAAKGAYAVLNRISDNGKWGHGSVAYKRAQKATGAVLNATPRSISVGDSTSSNQTITYNVTYDNRRIPTVSGAVSETINVTDSYPTDIYASIQIMGKRDGPVFQYMNTTTHYERDVSIELVMPQNFQGSPATNSITRPQLNDLLSSVAPGSTQAGYVMLKQLNESWSSSEGRYTVNAGWIYK